MANVLVTTSSAAPPYSETAEAVIAALRTDAHAGLSEAEARRRLGRDAPNELTAEKPVPAWRKFLAQFTDVLVILLLIATAISAVLWWLERESALPYEAIAIFAVVLLNAVMGFIQEERRQRFCAMDNTDKFPRPNWCAATSCSLKKATPSQPMRA